MEMNDMELAMYQQSAVRQDVLKGYTEGCDWESSNSSIADTTQALLEEFETVCEVYHDALTPPHSRTPSPPPPLIYIHPNFAQQLQVPLAMTQPVQDPPTINDPVDLAQELAMLDEIIRDRAASLDSVNPPAAPKDCNAAPEQSNLFGIDSLPAASVKITVPSTVVCDQVIEDLIVPDAEIPRVKVEVVSPALSPVSLQEVPLSAERFSSPMSYLSPSSVAPSSPSSPRPNTPASSCEDGEEASDPEWVPTKVSPVMRNTPKRQRAKPYARNTKIVSSGYSSSERSEMSIELSKPRGRRAPRVRGSLGHDDRKERKKEQNKNAATRYRQKKKAEAEEVFMEEKEMEDKNNELRAKAADLAKEVSYLKKLMREMFKARGML
ncbi:cyclic AMP-dependent transcription factor ATF-4 isoform X2 [Ischnura elegans]|nr:cyclic AMP-dependent transcription factor ATF-4 isoform X2 [Ischnura elegans]